MWGFPLHGQAGLTEKTMEKRMYVALWKSGRQAFLDLQKWKLECECPGGQIEQRDLEISPRFVRKMAAVNSPRFLNAVHVFSDVHFCFMLMFVCLYVWFLVNRKYDFFTWRRSVGFKQAVRN